MLQICCEHLRSELIKARKTKVRPGTLIQHGQIHNTYMAPACRVCNILSNILSNLYTDVLQLFVGNACSNVFFSLRQTLGSGIGYVDVRWWFQLEKETCLNYVSPSVLLFIPQDYLERNNAVPGLQECFHSSTVRTFSQEGI